MFKQLLRLGTAAVVLALAANSWAAQTWTVNFKDSDIQEVIKFVADVTGRTMVIDPRVKGRVKVISAKPLTEPELIHLFRTVLEMHDYSVVEVGDVLRIIPLKDTRSSPVPVTDGTSEDKGFLTQVIQLQNIAAAQVLPSIRPLVPQHSHLSAYDPSNAIIITDSAENIDRIRELIERLDQSATPTTEVVDLRYASAGDLVQILNNLDQESDSRRTPKNSLNLTADTRNNAILITGEDLQRQRIKTLIERLDRPKTQSGNVRVVYLNYADATKAAETLTRVMQNLSQLAPGGDGGDRTAATVEADEDTNALLITASGDDLQTLLDVVERLDIRRAQVLIEAIIAEVREDQDKDLGVSWLFQHSPTASFGSTTGGPGVPGSVGTIAGSALADPRSSDEALMGLGQGLLGAAGQILGVAGIHDDYSFLGILNALEVNERNNILSTPSILTMDNHEASFVVGRNIPILTGSSSGTNNLSPFQTIQRQDVGTKLTVKPQINADNHILLDVVQEVSDVFENSAQGFITSQRKIETQILAADGEIVVLGGLIEEKDTYNEQRVPLLGSVPIVGQLFRSTQTIRDRTNLMVFLKVSVIRDDEALAGATAEKYQHIRNLQLEQEDRGFLRKPRKDLPTLPDEAYYQLSPPIPADAVITPAAEKASEDEASEEQ